MKLEGFFLKDGYTSSLDFVDQNVVSSKKQQVKNL